MLNQQTNSLILASASPRRKFLLESCGFSVQVIPSKVEEIPKENESAVDYVLRNSREKGLFVSQGFHGDELILSADTIVVTKEGNILEKPLDGAHAKQMLTSLSNNSHLVYTAYSITQKKTVVLSRIVETKVRFRALLESEIEEYIASGEPFDKAGSYGIQGAAMSFVEHLDGSYTNVIGLPLSQLMEDLRTLFKK